MVQGVSIQDGCLVNTNPATGEVLSLVPCTTADQLDIVVAAAQAAQPAWASMSARDRVDLLRRGLQALAGKHEELSTSIVQEMGKPLVQAKAEMDGAVHKSEYLDLLVHALEPQQYGSSLVLRQPYGVVAILSPWNFPADEILLLALPALGSGNTVIVKPSEVVPETGRIVVETLASVLPKGVLQVVQGDGNTVGAPLVAHAGTNLIAMTGSSGTGKKIAETAAQSLKRVVLELGGKDPMVIFDDADLAAAAHDAVAYSLDNAGQVCCSMERIYVAESIYDEFTQLVTQAAAQYKVGHGVQPDVTVGPLVSSMQKDHVQRQVRDAVDKGAKVLYQSDIPDTPPGGSFFPVTVLSNVQPEMRMYREETFGPVVSLTPFDGTEQTAIRLANDTPYGLAAAVYTQDKVKAQRVASQIQAGQVGINCYSLEHMDVKCPWVGHKQSGLGYHSGIEGFHNFSIPQSLVFKP